MPLVIDVVLVFGCALVLIVDGVLSVGELVCCGFVVAVVYEFELFVVGY